MAGAAAATAKSSASKTVFNFASRCTCGKVEAAIETLEKAPPIRLVCYCSDCRGYYESLDRLALENGSAPSGILDVSSAVGYPCFVTVKFSSLFFQPSHLPCSILLLDLWYCDSYSVLLNRHHPLSELGRRRLDGPLSTRYPYYQRQGVFEDHSHPPHLDDSSSLCLLLPYANVSIWRYECGTSYTRSSSSSLLFMMWLILGGCVDSLLDANTDAVDIIQIQQRA